MSADQFHLLLDALACIDMAICEAEELDQLPTPVVRFLQETQAELCEIGRKVVLFRNAMEGGVQ